MSEKNWTPWKICCKAKKKLVVFTVTQPTLSKTPRLNFFPNFPKKFTKQFKNQKYKVFISYLTFFINTKPMMGKHNESQNVHLSRLVTKPPMWLCAQRRLRSAWASTQSDQSLLSAQWLAKGPSFLHADSENSDQTGRMPRLIWVFAGRTLSLLVLSWGGSFELFGLKKLGNKIPTYWPIFSQTCYSKHTYFIYLALSTQNLNNLAY